MSYYNKVILIGNLGKDPEIRSFQNGGKVANFSMATTEAWKDKDTGERKERTEWHSIAILNESLARVAEQYLKKGSKVLVEGKLRTRKWQDQSGNDRWTTEVVISGYDGVLRLMDAKGSGGRERSQEDSYGDLPGPSSGGGGAGEGTSSGHDYDDEIPF